jgi:uncharacterized protein YndB with AHSA1/START domain
MPTDITTSTSIEIKAPPERVWEALTTPDQIKRWFFGVDTETDWREGGPIVHRGEYQGRPYEDKGAIVKLEPLRLLVHTHWSPASGLPDDPENYQVVSWALTEREDATELSVREINVPSEQAKAVSEQSWDAALRALKDVVEAGEPRSTAG